MCARQVWSSPELRTRCLGPRQVFGSAAVLDSFEAFLIKPSGAPGCHPEAVESWAKPRTPNEGSLHSGGTATSEIPSSPTSPSFPSWIVGSTAPTNSCAVGDLYSVTSGTSGFTLWGCVGIGQSGAPGNWSLFCEL